MTEAADAEAFPVIRIAALAFRDHATTYARWQPTADYLSEQIPGRRFEIVPLFYREIEAAIAEKRVDFVLTNTGHYVMMEHRHGVTRLATLIAIDQGMPIRQFGGVIFARADRTDMATLSDLRDGTLLAVDGNSLGGYLVGLEILLEQGLEPGRHVQLNFTGMPHDDVVQGVLAGVADAGMVRTGILERMAQEGQLNLADLRLLNPRETSGFPFLHSTYLYPEWPFARMPHTEDILAEQVMVALLTLPTGHLAAEAGEYFGWSAPMNYRPVLELFRQLRIPPFDQREPLTLRYLWHNHPIWVVAFFVLLFLLMSVLLWQITRMNRRLRSEVSERRHAEFLLRENQYQLEFQASHDSLTCLYNRAALQVRLEQALVRARKNGHALAVMFLDLDRFKDINDSLGHPVGDQVLMEIGQRLRERSDATFTVGRVGGDEFLLVLDHLSEPRIDAAAQFARHTLAKLAQPFAVAVHPDLYVGGSIGIAIYPDDGLNSTQLIKNADAAMFKAKNSGRNTFCFYDQALTTAASDRLDLEGRLRRAVEQQALMVHYQPQIELRSGQIVGAEALLRWYEPDMGMISPARFIPLAEEIGLIRPIGEWVLRESSQQLRCWQQQGLPPIKLSVNLSPRQFMQPDLVERVQSCLVDAQLDPRWIHLELTESALMEHGPDAVTVLNELKALGLGLAIDDFGTGYSSLGHLKRFPIDVLKIDRCFISDIPQDNSDVEITTAIIAMAHSLRMRVIAEGVETEAQRAFLSLQGCDCYQGYLFSPAVSAQEFETLLRQQAHERSGLRTVCAIAP